MLMKTPGYRWEPEPRRSPRPNVSRLMPKIACIGIGISVLVIYGVSIVLVMERMTRPVSDAIVLTIRR